MKQVTLCVPLEVRPESCSRLTALIEIMKQREDKSGDPRKPNFWRLHESIPTLHFLSLSVFPSHDYDPTFLLEANFDGAEGVFWGDLEAVLGSDLRLAVRCCKRPRDDTAELYDAVCAPGSKRAVVSFLEARVQRPSVFHHGNRGLTCAQILRDHRLFLDARDEVDRIAPRLYRGETPGGVHKSLRAALEPRHLWLNARSPRRIPLVEGIVDWIRLVAFALAILGVLASPGLALVAAGVGPHHPLVMAVAALAVSVAVLIGWIRFLERHDSTNDRPKLDERVLRDMVRREDWVTQNHMGSLVLIKPGVLRTIIVRVGHHALHLALRALPNSRAGILGSMRTVHFAHWAFLNNRSRLLFLSNFDHSWDSYLDDFIEKAHGGLTLAWGCGVGFPATRLLVGEGAKHGPQFKAWALASRTVSRFWYSAYPDLTVDQIERNHRIAIGLRRETLDTKGAEAWMLDL
jgi:hypothetical protein